MPIIKGPIKFEKGKDIPQELKDCMKEIGWVTSFLGDIKTEYNVDMLDSRKEESDGVTAKK